MSTIAITIILVLSLLLCLTSYFAFKFAMILLNVEDTLEESLDILDEKYETTRDYSQIDRSFNFGIRRVY